MKEKLKKILRNIAEGYDYHVQEYTDEEGKTICLVAVENPNLIPPEVGNNVITITSIL